LSNDPKRRGILFILSGPSGSGKTTLLDGLQQGADFVYSISCTTRKPRPGEVDGHDYHFMSEAEFERRLAGDEFLEHAAVHGNHYGTLREMVMRNLDRGIDVMMDVDTQGAAMIRAHGNGALHDYIADVFLTTQDLDTLRRRLMKRATETPESLELRLKNALAEMRRWREYRYTIVSGSADDDVQNFRSIVRAERCISNRLFLKPNNE
jgi:guanylate kinase